MAVQPANKEIACAVCPAFLYRHVVSKFLTVVPGGPLKATACYDAKKILIGCSQKPLCFPANKSFYISSQVDPAGYRLKRR
jgi:hypothetical protein